MMILRNVSSFTSSEPFSRPDLSSDTEGYSAPESVTTVWHEGSEEDIIGIRRVKVTRGKI
jgi:hypothetical protein